MIKSLIIVVLLILVCVGAMITRPTEADFKPFIAGELSTAQTGGGLIGQIVGNLGADVVVQGYSFKNRYLWTEVRRSDTDKLSYVGVFDHWWGNSLQEDLKNLKRK